MGIFNLVILILFAVFILFSLVKFLKHNPEALSKINLSKSFYTMGVLAICLIVFIALMVKVL